MQFDHLSTIGLEMFHTKLMLGAFTGMISATFVFFNLWKGRVRFCFSFEKHGELASCNMDNVLK